jgi:hypothetical protein
MSRGPILICWTSCSLTAPISTRVSWEMGGFGVLEQVNPDEATPPIARGARIDVWAAANLGMMAELANSIAKDPALVHAKGGDGKVTRKTYSRTEFFSF